MNISVFYVKYQSCFVYDKYVQRYYGKSLPFGNSSFDIGKVHYLNMEQAIADYAVMIQFLQSKYKFTRVITFGGRCALKYVE